MILNEITMYLVIFAAVCSRQKNYQIIFLIVIASKMMGLVIIRPILIIVRCIA